MGTPAAENKKGNRFIISYLLAVRTGLEPATPGVTGLYSNQLNYRTNFQYLKNFLCCREVFFSIADAKIRIFFQPPNFS